MVPWWESLEFKPMSSILDGLTSAANTSTNFYDFALFVLAPDDVLISKGRMSSTARDNVIFELGLFLGAFGSDRTFAVLQEVPEQARKVKTPSDLGGIIIPTFVANSPRRLARTVGEAAKPIRNAILEKGRIPLRQKLRGLANLEWNFVWEHKAFKIDIPYESISPYQNLLKGKKLLLIALEKDDSLNREENPNITVGSPRQFPSTPQTISLVAPDRNAKVNIFADIKEGKEIEGCLLFIPEALKVERCRIIRDFLDAGSEIALIVGDIPTAMAVCRLKFE